MTWEVYNGGNVDRVAIGSSAVSPRYTTSKNPSTGLYYRLHILNVRMSDVEKYRCNGLVNGVIQLFYLQLNLLGRGIK